MPAPWRFPSLQKYYKQDNFNFLHHFLVNCLSLAAIEYMFRGSPLFGLKEKFKEGSILIQMIPFVLLHIGKPELEIHRLPVHRYFVRLYGLPRQVLLAGLYHSPVY